MRSLFRVLLIAVLVAGGLFAAVPELRDAADGAYRAVRPHVFKGNDEWCLIRLAELDARYVRVPDTRGLVGDNPQCGVQYGVAVSGVAGVDLPAPNIMTCRLAEQMTEWMSDGVQPAARAQLGAPVGRIDHVGIYSCRSIAGSGRLSQHAQANAIDIRGFTLADGREIRIGRHWGNDGPEGRFLRIAADAACDAFASVLTPEYNAAHSDHLHIDAGTFGICGM